MHDVSSHNIPFVYTLTTTVNTQGNHFKICTIPPKGRMKTGRLQQEADANLTIRVNTPENNLKKSTNAPKKRRKTTGGRKR